MYEKQSVEQRIGLIYGSRLRRIKGIMGLAGAANYHGIISFTAEEVGKIQDICAAAIDRATKEYQEARASLPPKDGHRA